MYPRGLSWCWEHKQLLTASTISMVERKLLWLISTPGQIRKGKIHTSVARTNMNYALICLRRRLKLELQTSFWVNKLIWTGPVSLVSQQTCGASCWQQKPDLSDHRTLRTCHFLFGPVEIRMKGTLARKTGSYTTRVIMMDYKTSSTYMRFTMHVVPRVSSEMQYMLGNHCFFFFTKAWFTIIMKWK